MLKGTIVMDIRFTGSDANGFQFDPNGENNQRGLAGAVALYHIAAAAAREGKTLDEVADIANTLKDGISKIDHKEDK